MRDVKPIWFGTFLGSLLVLNLLLVFYLNARIVHQLDETVIASEYTLTIDSRDSIKVLATEVTPVGPVIDEVLEALLAGWTQGQTGDFGIAVREVGGQQREAYYDKDRDFITASTYKLFLSYAVLSKIESGDLSFETKTSLGSTLDSCFDSLLVHSWDICAYPMGQLFGGWAELDKFLHEAGFENTNLNNYEATGDFTNADKHTSPSDEAELMHRLASGELLNEELTDYLLNLLKSQKWRERIPAGVPAGIAVADKPGWLYDLQNDAAIVYGEATTYVLVIMSNGSSAEALADLSGIVYDHLNPKQQ